MVSCVDDPDNLEKKKAVLVDIPAGLKDFAIGLISKIDSDNERDVVFHTTLEDSDISEYFDWDNNGRLTIVNHSYMDFRSYYSSPEEILTGLYSISVYQNDLEEEVKRS